jgi:hypothetical protein
MKPMSEHLHGNRTEVRPSDHGALGDWQSPPPEYRPAPFFILNEDLTSETSRRRITQMLEQYRDLGYGGAYLHPRLGLITEYKSDAWFESIAYCLAEAERLGLKTYLYDENSYPSGFAGGHVPAAHPEARVRYLGFEILRSLPNALNHFTTAIDASDLFLAAYHLESEAPLRIGTRLSSEELAIWVQDQHCSIATGTKPQGAVLAFHLREMKGAPWYGEFPYVSLADPAVAPAFLRMTHDEYAKRFQPHFGGSIPAIFTDEPNLHTLDGESAGTTLHLTPYILGQFVERRGYDLRTHLAELFFDYGDFASVRFDYYETLHELWFENWALPLEKWCREHGIALTGHYLEHDWPTPYSTPGHVHMLAHMDWPGIDLLLVNGLIGGPAPWFSTQERSQAGREPLLTLLIQQCASVARQFGKQKVLCEAWGAGGHASTPADFKRLGDWLIVNGVNHLVPHHSFMTIRGARKTDHPQFFSDQSSWYLHTRVLNDHLARLCQAMSQGIDSRSILVVDPLTSGYLTAARGKPLRETHGSMSNSFSHLVQQLSDRFLPFDLGDEYVLAESGSCERSRLRLGQQLYSTIVLAPEIKNLKSTTLRLLRAYLDQGGEVWDLMTSPPRIDGRVSDAWEVLRERHRAQIREARDPSGLADQLAFEHPPALSIRNPEGLLGFAHSRRKCEDAEIHLLVYSGDKRGSVTVSLDARSVTIMDTLTGEEKRPATTTSAEGLLSFEWQVDGPDSLLFSTKARVSSAIPLSLPQTVETDSAPLILKAIERESGNRLVLDFCDLHLRGRAPVMGIRALMAQKEVFCHHGFLRNPWHRAIQYRTQILDRNHFAAGTGFEAVFPFHILPGTTLENVRVAVEIPKFFRLAINGTLIDHGPGTGSEIDPWVREFPIAQWLREGRNEISVVADPFDVRIELDNIYLVGDFSVWNAENGFLLGAPVRPLVYGSWKEQGCPFYDRNVLYRFEIPEAPEDAIGFLLEMDAACSLADILVDGKQVAQWGYTRRPAFLPREVIESGRELAIRIIGSPHNLFGAFHDANLQPGVMGNPFAGPRLGPVPGERYALKDYGLMKCPALRPLKSARPLPAHSAREAVESLHEFAT